MTQEAIRIAIAKACGWTRTKSALGDYFIWITPDGKGCGKDGAPNYPSDLNAMAEAEKTLTGNELTIYDNALHRICGSVSAMKFATAQQRADAFIETKEIRHTTAAVKDAAL